MNFPSCEFRGPESGLWLAGGFPLFSSSLNVNTWTSRGFAYPNKIGLYFLCECNLLYRSRACFGSMCMSKCMRLGLFFVFILYVYIYIYAYKIYMVDIKHSCNAYVFLLVYLFYVFVHLFLVLDLLLSVSFTLILFPKKNLFLNLFWHKGVYLLLCLFVITKKDLNFFFFLVEIMIGFFFRHYLLHPYFSDCIIFYRLQSYI